MNINFDKKVHEIKKLLDTWVYRGMSVYGKIVIIKTLALSKLSHLALVLPNLNKNDIKKLESLFFNFIWGGRPAKVSSAHVYLRLAPGQTLETVRYEMICKKYSHSGDCSSPKMSS